MATPLICFEVLHESGLQRISMDISNRLQQVAVRTNQNGLVAPSEKLTIASVATIVSLMMKNGAPVRYIQELLGHESLESTQIYTRVTINELKAVHSKYHPGNLFESKE